MENLVEGEFIKIINIKSSPEWNNIEAQVIKVIFNDDNEYSYIIKNTNNNNLMKIKKYKLYLS